MLIRFAAIIAAQFAREFLKEFGNSGTDSPLQLINLGGLETEISGDDDDTEVRIGFRRGR